MSGGHWNYKQRRIEEWLTDVGVDGQVILRFPHLATVLRKLAAELESTISALDYDLSGDTTIEDDGAFEKAALAKLAEALSVAPEGVQWFAYFPRGLMGPFYTQEEAWEALHTGGEGRPHVQGGYVWSEKTCPKVQ